MSININTAESDAQNQHEDSGWHAQLNLEITYRGDKSVVSNSKQKGPLSIQSPFYPEKEVCHLYLLHPPAGIVSGDKLQLNITAKNKGTALITTPGATKFYRSNGLLAEQHQGFRIFDNSTLEWLPQETIYFPSANAKLNTTVHLEGSGSYIGWEINCLGLPANEKDFADGQAQICFSLFRDKQPLLLESIKISKAKRSYQAAFLQDQPILGSLVASGGSEQLIELLREKLLPAKNGNWATTLLNDILVLRYLGKSTNEVRELFVQAWKTIRPHIRGKEAVIPRIWNT